MKKSRQFYQIQLLVNYLFYREKKNFNLEKYPPEYKKILESSKKDFLPVHNFLSKINNPFLKAELSADYEVLAQYQAFELENLKLHRGIKDKIFSDHKVLVKYMLKNNFLDYLKLSFFHYLGNWSIGSKILYLEKIEEEPPHYDKLSKVSGEINLPKDFFINFCTIIFLFSICSYAGLYFNKYFKYI